MFQRKVLEPETFEVPTLAAKNAAPMGQPNDPYLEAAREVPRPQAYRGRQHQLMVGSLVLLLVALGLLIYNDRDFWFPDTLEADDVLPGEVMASPATVSANSVDSKAVTSKSFTSKSFTSKTGASPSGIDAERGANKRSDSRAQTKESGPDGALTIPPVTAVRTVLPPLQVEVVAGNIHNTVHPGTNSVHVDLQPGSQPQSLSDPAAVADAETAAGVTSNIAENVRMSGTSEVVSRSVTPNYPLLARQMKVQGSVILQALINRDGSIQDLRIVSGPPILATAAREAVRQWHFKPRYQGSEVIETLARITVNFTISTN